MLQYQSGSNDLSEIRAIVALVAMSLFGVGSLVRWPFHPQKMRHQITKPLKFDYHICG